MIIVCFKYKHLSLTEPKKLIKKVLQKFLFHDLFPTFTLFLTTYKDNQQKATHKPCVQSQSKRRQT